MGRVVMNWILAVVCVSSTWAGEPANRQSNPQVKAVLEYFYSLSGKADDRIVSGQFTDPKVIVNEPMYLLINFGIDAKWPGPCDETTPFPSYYECDRIRVYEKD